MNGKRPDRESRGAFDLRTFSLAADGIKAGVFIF